MASNVQELVIPRLQRSGTIDAEIAKRLSATVAYSRNVEIDQVLLAESGIPDEILYEDIAKLMELAFVGESKIYDPSRLCSKKMNQDSNLPGGIKAFKAKGLAIYNLPKAPVLLLAKPLNQSSVDLARRMVRNLKIKGGMAVCSPLALSKLYAKSTDWTGTILTAIEKMYQLGSPSSEEVGQTALAILEAGVRMNASDIHIKANSFGHDIRFRIDGTMEWIAIIPYPFSTAVVNAIQRLGNLQVTHSLIKDANVKIEINDISGKRAVHYRLSSIPSVNGVASEVSNAVDRQASSLVMRILDTEKTVLPLPALGFDNDVLEDIVAAYSRSNGLILVTGPTGSGKSTTLAAILNACSTSDKNVISIDNPTEYMVKSVEHLEVDNENSRTFEALMKTILRRDPDIVKIEEIRDAMSADTAVKLCQTGHLTLGTLHCNRSTDAIPRLKSEKDHNNVPINTIPIISNLNLILAQRLVRINCPHCATKMTKKELLSILGEKHAKSVDYTSSYLAKNKFFKGAGKGCYRCNGTGISGRKTIAESLFVDTHVKELMFVLDKDLNEIQFIRSLREYHGFKTMFDKGLDLMIQGDVNIHELLRQVDPYV